MGFFIVFVSRQRRQKGDKTTQKIGWPVLSRASSRASLTMLRQWRHKVLNGTDTHDSQSMLDLANVPSPPPFKTKRFERGSSSVIRGKNHSIKINHE